VETGRARELSLIQSDAAISLDYQSRQATVRKLAAGEQAVEQIQAGEEEPLKLELDAFLQAVRTGTPPVVSGQDGEAALALADRVLKEIEKGRQK
jgi:predicted dehydrogenase